MHLNAFKWVDKHSAALDETLRQARSSALMDCDEFAYACQMDLGMNPYSWMMGPRLLSVAATWRMPTSQSMTAYANQMPFHDYWC